MPEIVERLPDPISTLAGGDESGGIPILLAARRAFAVAQSMLAGSPIGQSRKVTAGWYDSSVNPESGSFAVVQTGAGLDDLIGEVIVVAYKRRSVFAYVLQAADVPTQVAVTRRAFLALSVLTAEQIAATVAATQ